MCSIGLWLYGFKFFFHVFFQSSHPCFVPERRSCESLGPDSLAMIFNQTNAAAGRSRGPCFLHPRWPHWSPDKPTSSGPLDGAVLWRRQQARAAAAAPRGCPHAPAPGTTSSWNVPGGDGRRVLLQGRGEEERKAAQQRQEVVRKTFSEGQRQKDNGLRLQSFSCLRASASAARRTQPRSQVLLYKQNTSTMNQSLHH